MKFPVVIVDTSVWINYFANKETEKTNLLDRIIDDNIDLATCGPILMEIIQGCRSDKDTKIIKEYMSDLLHLPTEEMYYQKSAEMYRKLRKRGLTIRKSIDCLIATVAINTGCAVLSEDRDFENIAKYTSLKILNK